MRLRDLLGIPELRLALRTDAGSLDRPIRWVYVTELLDPARYLTGNELVLTGLMWRRRPEDSDRFAATAAAAGVAAVGAGTAVHGSVPPDFVTACRRHRLPLVEVPIEVSFGTVSEIVTRQLSAERANGLASALGRHRRLVGAVAEGEGMGPVFALARRDLGLSCWVISATGRIVSGGGPLSPAQARALAAAFLAAERLPRVAGAGDTYTLLPVDTRGGHRAGGWFLACEGVLSAHGEEIQESVYELATLAALEWARLEEGRRVERRLAGRLVELSAEAEPGAVAAQLRACGMSPREPFAVVAAGFPDAGPAAAAAVLEEILHGGVVAGSKVPVAALPGETLAAGPASGHGGNGGPVPGDGAAGQGPAGREAVALVPLGRDGSTEPLVRLLRERTLPLCPDGAGRPAPPLSPEPAMAAEVAAARRATPASAAARTPSGAAVALEWAAAPDAASRVRVAVGVSGAVRSPDGVRTAVDEARHARRLAALRPGAVHVVTSDEICSHALLLASVPEGVRRSFRERLLRPLLDYDGEHGSDLVGTLRAFLDSSGSWNKCATVMHVHVNTLRYRIRRIEELTGRDLGSLETRVDFFLALEAV